METKITILISHRLLVRTLHFVAEIKDAQTEFLLAASIVKQMEIQFNSIRQENDKQFINLSKKIDRKYHADAVRYSRAIGSAFTVDSFDLIKIDLSYFRDPSDAQTFSDVVCL